MNTMMLETACRKVGESSAALDKIRKDQKEIEKNKRTMLDLFCSSQNNTKKRKIK